MHTHTHTQVVLFRDVTFEDCAAPVCPAVCYGGKTICFADGQEYLKVCVCVCVFMYGFLFFFYLLFTPSHTYTHTHTHTHTHTQSVNANPATLGSSFGYLFLIFTILFAAGYVSMSVLVRKKTN
jgi:hypothetical protein